MKHTRTGLTEQKKEYIVWRMLDGKAGHEAQTLGLIAMLADRVALQVVEIRASKRWKSFVDRSLENFPPGKDLPPPDLIIGAGNRTHLAMIAARRAYGGQAIVLMQPSLPMWMFDLCLIPRHDLKEPSEYMLLTDGVLNALRPATSVSMDKGLILVGGPSKHYRWDTTQMLKQVKRLVKEQKSMEWTLTTSRRTPKDSTKELLALKMKNLQVIPLEKTQPGWVADQLQGCGVVWVSEDSVSMVYESLTVGALTGLLEVPAKKKSSRVRKSVNLLMQQGRVVRFADREQLLQLERNEPLSEARRCADYIVTQMLAHA